MVGRKYPLRGIPSCGAPLAADPTSTANGTYATIADRHAIVLRREELVLYAHSQISLGRRAGEEDFVGVGDSGVLLRGVRRRCTRFGVAIGTRRYRPDPNFSSLVGRKYPLRGIPL